MKESKSTSDLSSLGSTKSLGSSNSEDNTKLSPPKLERAKTYSNERDKESGLFIKIDTAAEFAQTTIPPNPFYISPPDSSSSLQISTSSSSISSLLSNNTGSSVIEFNIFGNFEDHDDRATEIIGIIPMIIIGNELLQQT